jgi:hypothetical protein
VNQKEVISVNDVSRQNFSTCQHWHRHSNFENEGPVEPPEPGSNTSIVRSFRRSDPFLPENRIPLPKLHCNKRENSDYEGTNNVEGCAGVFFYAVQSPTIGRRRNERERQGVRSMNEGFERLRKYLPIGICVRMRRRVW